jgi:hypothetical protein
MAQNEGHPSPTRSIRTVSSENDHSILPDDDGNPQIVATNEPQLSRPTSETTRVASATGAQGPPNLQHAFTGDEHATPTRQSSARLVAKASPASIKTINRKNNISHRSHKFTDQWIWELLSCCVALLCLLAIITVLAIHRDRPLPQWPRMISINSLIAIFTALMKAALIFPIAEGDITASPRSIDFLLILNVGISQAKWIWFQRQPRNLSDFQDFDSASRGPWGSLLLLTKPRRQ